MMYVCELVQCTHMWDMADCTCMASGECQFLGHFFDLKFISTKYYVFVVFSDMSRYVFSKMTFSLKDLVLYFSIY